MILKKKKSKYTQTITVYFTPTWSWRCKDHSSIWQQMCIISSFRKGGQGLSCTNKRGQAPCWVVFEFLCLRFGTCTGPDKAGGRRFQPLSSSLSLTHLLICFVLCNTRNNVASCAVTPVHLLYQWGLWSGLCIIRQGTFGFEKNKNKSLLLATTTGLIF